MLQALAPTPRPARTAADHAADRNPVDEAAAKRLFDAAVQRRTLENQKRYTAPRRRRNSKRRFDLDAVPVPPLTLFLDGPVDSAKRVTSDPDTGRFGLSRTIEDFDPCVKTWAAMLYGAGDPGGRFQPRPFTAPAMLRKIVPLSGQVGNAPNFKAQISKLRAELKLELQT